MRLTAIPCLLTAVVCTAVAAFVVQAGGARITGREWAVLSGGLAVVCVIVLTASAAANAEARAMVTRYARLRQVCARSRSDLSDLVDRVRQGEWLQRRDPEPGPPPTGDTLELLAHEVAAAGRAAESAVAEAVAIARSDASGNEQKVEVFVNLARRLQSLVHREIELLDEMENQVEDPDLLKGLFHVDHLATRIRRHAENLAVLGGAVSRRQWSRPVSMTEVLRSSIAEVEQYPRIKLVPPIEGTLGGHAVADVIHLLAELVENATIYSAPQTPVMLRTQLVTAGLAVEVEDRGLGMSTDEQTRMNELLADPDHIDVAELLSDGRIGLFVVSSLARRHGIVVRLQSNIYGGVQAVLIIPKVLLGAEPADGAEAGETDRADAPGTGFPDTDPAREHGRYDGEEGRYDRGYDDGQEPDAPRAIDRYTTHDRDRRDLGDPSPLSAAVPAPGPAPDSAPAHDVSHRRPAHAPGGRTPDATRADAHASESSASDDGTADGLPADPGTLLLPPAPPASADHGARPRLPRRRKQTHLAPELRGDPILPSAARRTGPEPEHDPGLMAAFRRGFSLADDTYAGRTDDTGTLPAQGGGDRCPAGDDLSYDRDHDAPMGRPRGDDRNHGE
ncbi:ATP-binding protein [Streptomyces sp. NPDC001339]|uniref:sensor histidine kinase n=1 Tax=Streptomyces sp. NPDC001339 TaxID=3364563 RepID=UPI003695F398